MISIPSTFRRFRPFFLLYLRPWLSIRPLPYAVARAIGNTNDMRFSYDHIADVRRVRMRPHGHGHLTRPRITPIHTLVRTHRLPPPHQFAIRTRQLTCARCGPRCAWWNRGARRAAPRSPAAPTRQSIAESRIRCRRRGDSSARRTTPATRCAGRREPGRCVAVHPLKAARPTRRRGYQGPAGASRPVQARKPWQARRAARHHRQKGSTGWKARNQRHSTKREERAG